MSGKRRQPPLSCRKNTEMIAGFCNMFVNCIFQTVHSYAVDMFKQVSIVVEFIM